MTTSVVPPPSVVPHPEHFFIGTLNKLAQDIHALARSKGWYDADESDDEFVLRAVANLHGEVSEFFDAFRMGSLFKPCDKAVPLTCAEEELADIVIRALDDAARLKIDIGRAVALKHSYNASRPYRHGGKKA